MSVNGTPSANAADWKAQKRLARNIPVKVFLNGQSNTLLIQCDMFMYEGWIFNSGNYLFTTDTK